MTAIYINQTSQMERANLRCYIFLMNPSFLEIVNKTSIGRRYSIKLPAVNGEIETETKEHQTIKIISIYNIFVILQGSLIALKIADIVRRWYLTSCSVMENQETFEHISCSVVENIINSKLFLAE